MNRDPKIKPISDQLREMTPKERKRFADRKYTPCLCGSGLKLKFCCWSQKP